MGCESSIAVGAKPLVLSADIRTFAGVIFHHEGVFVVTYDGKYRQTNSRGWPRAQVALPDGKGNVMCLHDKAAYLLPFATNLSSYTKFPTRFHHRESLRWADAEVLVRQPSDPEHVICFHGTGVYKIKVQDGSFMRVNRQRWSGARAAVMNPGEPGYVYIFHSDGLYKASLVDGRCEQVGSSTWGWARAAVYLPKQRKVLVFHAHSICHVDLEDGSSVDISRRDWSGTRAAVLMKDDPCTVLAIHTTGLYHVNVTNGSYETLSLDGWGQATAFAPLAEGSFVSCKSFCGPAVYGGLAAGSAPVVTAC